jgi:hypothetical protein
MIRRLVRSRVCKFRSTTASSSIPAQGNFGARTFGHTRVISAPTLRDKISFWSQIFMDSYSILAPATPDGAELMPPTGSAEVPGVPHSTSSSLPANGSSAPAMAERDLRASLQLLADRMQHLTGASAATVALAEGHEMVCRASVGPMATELGAPVRADATLVIQSIRTQQIICCNNTRNGARGDGTSYRALGIKAIMVMPLIRESKVVGMLELLADKTGAFDDRDGAALEHLSEMVLTAVEHADAAKRAVNELAYSVSAQEFDVPAGIIPPPAHRSVAPPAESLAAKQLPEIHHCAACGFPVSTGRVLCLDCEEARTREAGNGTAPAFLSQLAREHEESWLQSHFYTIGTVLMVVLTVVVLMLKLR